MHWSEKVLNGILKYVVGIMVIGVLSSMECILLEMWGHDNSFLSVLLAFIAPFPPLLLCIVAVSWDKVWGFVLMITSCLVQFIIALVFTFDVPLDQQSPYMPVLALVYIASIISFIVFFIKNRKEASGGKNPE